MYKNSYDKIKNVKISFNNLIENIKNIKDQLEDMYIHVYHEAKEEVTQKQEKSIRIQKRTLKLYNKLDFDLCTKLIRKILPLRVKLFNKIHCSGFRIYEEDTIQVAFYFNDKREYIYYYNFASYQIKTLLNIK